jgi:hypothetical protein
MAMALLENGEWAIEQKKTDLTDDEVNVRQCQSWERVIIQRHIASLSCMGR